MHLNDLCLRHRHCQADTTLLLKPEIALHITQISITRCIQDNKRGDGLVVGAACLESR